MRDRHSRLGHVFLKTLETPLLCSVLIKHIFFFPNLPPPRARQAPQANRLFYGQNLAATSGMVATQTQDQTCWWTPDRQGGVGGREDWIWVGVLMNRAPLPHPAIRHYSPMPSPGEHLPALMPYPWKVDFCRSWKDSTPSPWDRAFTLFLQLT